MRVELTKFKTKRARELRRHMTDAEKKLWNKLRNRQLNNLKFRRQVPFGHYYLDFYCPQKQLVIEVDGGQHYTNKGQSQDIGRTSFIRKNGLKIVRYSDRDVLLNISSVLRDILHEIKSL